MSFSTPADGSKKAARSAAFLEGCKRRKKADQEKKLDHQKGAIVISKCKECHLYTTITANLSGI